MEAIQQALTVFLVLLLLGGTLWWLRRKGIAGIGAGTRRGRRQRSMEILERLPLTPQHSLHLVRVANRVVLVAASPNGCSVLDSSGDLHIEGDLVA